MKLLSSGPVVILCCWLKEAYLLCLIWQCTQHEICVQNGYKQQGRKRKLPSYSHLDTGLTHVSVNVHPGIPEGGMSKFSVHRRSMNHIEYVRQ